MVQDLEVSFAEKQAPFSIKLTNKQPCLLGAKINIYCFIDSFWCNSGYFCVLWHSIYVSKV